MTLYDQLTLAPLRRPVELAHDAPVSVFTMDRSERSR